MFDKYPYTNFHELNLDWIINEVKKMVEECEQRGTAIEKNLYKKLEAKLGNLPAQAEQTVKNLISDMVKKGEFKTLVNSAVDRAVRVGLAQVEDMVAVKSGVIDAKIAGIKDRWTPSGEDYADYVADSLRCVVSYLAHNAGSNSIADKDQPANLDTPFVVKYSQNKNYADAMQNGSTSFVTTDKETVDGVEFPVAWLDCSSFLSLITKCRFYGADTNGQKNISPYYYAFKNNLSGDNEAILNYCVEAGSNDIKPYTFDFKNNIYTQRMAYLMDSAGNKLEIFSKRSVIGVEPEMVVETVSKMATGDIMFFSKPSSDGYKGITHCGYFVKTLGELNTIGREYYNIAFKPVGAATSPEYGYIVHVGNSLDDSNDKTDVLRIQTIHDVMKNGGFIKGFVCKPYSNALISSKAERSAVGLFRTTQNTFVCSRDTSGNNFPSPYGWDSSGNFTMNNAGIGAELLSEDADLNNIPNGSYYVAYSSSYNTMQNIPAALLGSSFVCQIFQFGKRSNGTRGVQFCIVNSSNKSRFFIRSANTSGVWDEWKEFGAET